MTEYPTSFDRDELLKCARGELFGPGNAQLPMPPMLMMDRITEVSSDGGGSWVTVVEVQKGNDNGTFVSGTIFPAGADDNPNLQLRFRAKGKGKGGYCYGDDVIVLGTLIGGLQSAP